jgi:hypothetical protein
MSTPLRPRTTMAFFVQSAISFAVSLTVTITGIGYLHDSRWVRAFLALGLLYVVTSSFTLAKCIRDATRKPPSSAASTRPGWTSCWRNKTSSESRTTDSRLQPGPVRPPGGHERARSAAIEDVHPSRGNA